MSGILYYRDDLDKKIKKINPSLGLRTDFSTLRDAAYAQVIGEYNRELITADDDWGRGDNFAAPLTTGSTETVNTASYDIWQLARASTQIRIAGNDLYLQKTTTTFFKVPRIAFDDIIVAGVDATLYAFYENKDKINLIIKDAEFVAPASLCYNFYRWLDNTLPDASTTPLDIKFDDFESIAERVTNYMSENA